MNTNGADQKQAAERFTSDARVFIRSLTDAVVCAKQLSAFSIDEFLYDEYTNELAHLPKSKQLLLAKYCKHELCNVNVIAATNVNSYYTYFMTKFAINLFLTNINQMQKSKTFPELLKEMDAINNSLNIQLRNYINYTKDKHFNI